MAEKLKKQTKSKLEDDELRYGAAIYNDPVYEPLTREEQTVAFRRMRAIEQEVESIMCQVIDALSLPQETVDESNASPAYSAEQSKFLLQTLKLLFDKLFSSNGTENDELSTAPEPEETPDAILPTVKKRGSRIESRSVDFLAGRTKIVQMQNDPHIQELQREWRNLRNTMVVTNCRLVEKCAFGMTHNRTDFCLAMSVGIEKGLMRDVELFDPELNVAFSTYAFRRIRQSIGVELGRERARFKIPKHARDDMKHIDKNCPNWKNMSSEDIAKESGLSLEKVRNVLDVMIYESQMVELDSPYDNSRDEESDPYDHVQGEFSGSKGEKKVELNNLAELMEEAISSLTERERLIIKLRFGFIDGKCWGLQEVGDEIGITRARVQQIETRVLRKLKHPFVLRKLMEYKQR